MFNFWFVSRWPFPHSRKHITELWLISSRDVYDEHNTRRLRVDWSTLLRCRVQNPDELGAKVGGYTLLELCGTRRRSNWMRSVGHSVVDCRSLALCSWLEADDQTKLKSTWPTWMWLSFQSGFDTICYDYMRVAQTVVRLREQIRCGGLFDRCLGWSSALRLCFYQWGINCVSIMRMLAQTVETFSRSQKD